jgi:hypothetical protein
MTRASLLMLLTAASLSCGGTSNSLPVDNLDAGEVIDCATDARVFNYQPGMSVKSASGNLNFQLLSSNPGPPAKGTDVWSLKVTNAAGQSQSNLNMSVLPFMPDHGHGTSIDAQITAGADGTYSVKPIYFFMPGVWRITFSTAAPSDTAVFFFCVPG